MAQSAVFASPVGQIRVLVEDRTLDGHVGEDIMRPLVQYVDVLRRNGAISLDRFTNGLPSAAPIISFDEALRRLETVGLDGDTLAPFNPISQRVCLLMHPDNRLGFMNQVLGAVPIGCHALSSLEVGGWNSSTLLRYEMPVPCRVRQLVLRGSRRVVCGPVSSRMMAGLFRTQAAGVQPYTVEEFELIAQVLLTHDGLDRVLNEGAKVVITKNTTCECMLHY